jgi:hypothetical protein
MEEDPPEDDDEDDEEDASSSKFKFGALCDQSTDLLCSRSYRCGCFSSFTSSFIFFDDDGEKRRSSPSSTKAATVVVAVVLAPRGMVPTTTPPMLLKSEERRSNAQIHDRRIILSLFGSLFYGEVGRRKNNKKGYERFCLLFVIAIIHKYKYENAKPFYSRE